MIAEIFSNDFNRIVVSTRGFVSKNVQRPQFKYICLEFNAADSMMTAVALDGYRMSVEHAVCQCDEDFTAYIHGAVALPRNMDAVIEVANGETIIRCGGSVFGCANPKVDKVFDWKAVLPKAPTFQIGFNGNYLLSALQAAKASTAG